MNRAICTQEELEAMKNVDIRTVNPATLRDIRDVVRTDTCRTGWNRPIFIFGRWKNIFYQQWK